MVFKSFRIHLLLTGLILCFSMLCILRVSGTETQDTSGDIIVETNVDRSEVTVGDPITYTLTIRYRPGMKLVLPGWGVNLGQFEIQDYDVSDPVPGDGFMVQESRYRIATYYAENYTIPPITIKYMDKDNMEHEITSEPIEITVNSVAPSEADDIRTIKPPLDIEPDYTSYYFLGAGIVFLAAMIASLVWYLKWRRKKKLLAPKPVEPPRPAHELAYEDLDALIKSGLLDENRFKEYYFELSEIIRRYLGNRYCIPTLERTSAEILFDLDDVDEIAEKVFETVTHHFSNCDMVKFAKYVPSQEEIHDDTDEARTIIDVTRVSDDTGTATAPERVLTAEGSEVDTAP